MQTKTIQAEAGSEQVTPARQNIFLDLGFSAEEAEQYQKEVNFYIEEQDRKKAMRADRTKKPAGR